jgi:hypothetical protein
MEEFCGALNSWVGFLENKIVKRAGKRKKSRTNREKKPKTSKIDGRKK